MNCQQARPLIDFYADGELDAAGILELEKHFHDCPACALAWRNAQTLKKSLKQDSLFFTAPTGLRRRIKVELDSQVETKSRWNFWNWNWLTAATSGFATACLVLLLTMMLTRPSAQQQFTQEIVSSHIRSLMENHLLDVVSTDQHTVKPWFDGKLDFAPDVKDFAAQGFPLVGGRLDYLNDRAVAALVYRRNKHLINVFVWPAQGANTGKTENLRGYSVISRDVNGFHYCLVSDLNEKELGELADLLGK
ncbi:MAG TPA: anti-sigma factor [Dongiaceae bacterium]|jgi:anti-sigma factor RsiW|nr:anti-sigma factor [Dongiaceae bacterium]